MATTGEILIPMDKMGERVRSYFVNWAYPGDIMPDLEKMDEKQFMRLAGKGAIRGLGTRSMIASKGSLEGEVGRPKKVAHYLQDDGETPENSPPKEVSLKDIAKGGPVPENVLHANGFYIHDGSKWRHFTIRDFGSETVEANWDHEWSNGASGAGQEAKKAWDMDARRKMVVGLQKIICKRFETSVRMHDPRWMDSDANRMEDARRQNTEIHAWSAADSERLMAAESRTNLMHRRLRARLLAESSGESATITFSQMNEIFNDLHAILWENGDNPVGSYEAANYKGKRFLEYRKEVINKFYGGS